jgi:hypothetical protein
MVDSALNALKTFDVTGENYLSVENKRLLTSTLFDVENDLEGEPIEKEVPEIEDDFQQDDTEQDEK